MRAFTRVSKDGATSLLPTLRDARSQDEGAPCAVRRQHARRPVRVICHADRRRQREVGRDRQIVGHEPGVKGTVHQVVRSRRPARHENPRRSRPTVGQAVSATSDRTCQANGSFVHPASCALGPAPRRARGNGCGAYRQRPARPASARHRGCAPARTCGARAGCRTESPPALPTRAPPRWLGG